MKKLFAVVAVLAASVLVLVVAALTGCSGSSLDLKISGDIGEEVKFESGYPIKDIGDSVELVEKGNGPAKDTKEVVARLTLFNGIDGLSLGSQGATLPTETDAQTSPWVKKVIESTGFEQRAVVAGSISSLLGPDAATQLGLKPTDPVVIVADILDKPLSKAEGKKETLPEGFPTVKLAENGEPTVTLPPGNPPADLKIANTIVGDGAEVQDGDFVLVHYQGTNWNTGKIFDSSWERNAPTGFSTAGVVEGFSKALVGQKVGSQVVAIIPPAQGYGEAGNPPNIGPTDTLVFVVDILGVVNTK